MENQYFTRSLKEGTVCRTRLCSFDKTIKLEMLVQRSGKVINSMLVQNAAQPGKEVKDDSLQRNFIQRLSGLRINGLPIIIEELGNCFDVDEVTEVMAFVNNSDMKIFDEDIPAETSSDSVEESSPTSDTEEVKNA